MPRIDTSQVEREKIGTARVQGQRVDVYYVGGSMFELEFDGANTDKPPRLDRTVVDKLREHNQIQITSEHRYAEICAAILPDGSTKTHNADGTVKSKVAQALDSLAEEGHISKTETGGFEANTNKPEKKASRPKPSRGGQIAAVPDPFAEGSAFVESAAGLDEALDEEPFPDGDPFANQPEPAVDPFAEVDARESGKRRAPGDLNGDGVVDEMDTFVAQDQKKSGLLMVSLVISIIVSIGLFFGSYIVYTKFIGGGTVDLPEISSPFGQSGNQNENVQPENQGDADQGENNENTENTTQNPSGMETVVRTDFDPENAVKDFPIASADNEKIAIAMFQAIRTAILNGNVKGFNDAIDIERIAGQVAPAYADVAAGAQQLSEAEKADTLADYHSQFVINERQHVVDRDVYASIFGGRIREVRQDPANPYRLYVVMESIAGDHQRACFAMDGDATGAWTVVDLLDPVGYVNMIAA